MSERDLADKLETILLVYNRDMEALREEISRRELNVTRQLKALRKILLDEVEAYDRNQDAKYREEMLNRLDANLIRGIKNV